MFKNVHGRLGVVLFCLVHGKGSNELVKKITGKLFCDSTLPNDEIGSDGSVAIRGITTTALQAKDVIPG